MKLRNKLKLVDEKSVLEKNINAVWTTAKAEMDRKDKRIGAQ